MEITNGKDLTFELFGADTADLRGGELAFKTLLEGDPGTCENYSLVLAKQYHGFYSPRHRHNFDQIRFAYRGDIQISPSHVLKEGFVGFFPEGTYYGPQEDPPGDRITLVLQFGGASRLGYMSQKDLLFGISQLECVGNFEDGVFYRNSGYGEREKSKKTDSYEAVWEYINKKRINYPPPRYHEPILMNPANFEWCDLPGSPNVQQKHLGTFTERKAKISFTRLKSGATYSVSGDDAMQLIFVIEGEAKCNGQRWTEESAVAIDSLETADILALSNTTFLTMELPVLDKIKRAADIN